ncbi:hypothetical protein ACROYT_G043225 [Oculina patagonica]
MLGTFTNPPPANNGTSCRGPAQETQICTTKMCPTSVTNTESCQDINGEKTCRSWKRFCKTSLYVQLNCAKTCGECQVCENSVGDSYCEEWSDFCSRQNSAFPKICKKTCGLC